MMPLEQSLFALAMIHFFLYYFPRACISSSLWLQCVPLKPPLVNHIGDNKRPRSRENNMEGSRSFQPTVHDSAQPPGRL